MTDQQTEIHIWQADVEVEWGLSESTSDGFVDLDDRIVTVHVWIHGDSIWIGEVPTGIEDETVCFTIPIAAANKADLDAVAHVASLIVAKP